jgi:DNA-binding beta-propeller fold protein YncE
MVSAHSASATRLLGRTLAVVLAAALLAGCVRVSEQYPSRIIDHIEFEGPVSTLAVSPDGERLYIAWHWAPADGDISILGTDDHEVLGRVTCGQRQSGMLLTPDGRWLYTGDAHGPYERGGRVRAVDTEGGKVITIEPVLSSPLPLVVSRDSRVAYIGSESGYKVHVVNVGNQKIVDTIVINGGTSYGALSPDGKQLYIGFNGITVVNTKGNTIAGSALPTKLIHGLAVTRNPDRLFAAAWVPDDTFWLYSLRLPDLVVEDSVLTEHVFEEIVASPDGRFIYGISMPAKAVYVYRTEDGVVADSISLKFVPTCLKVHPDGSRLYVTGYQQNQVTVIGY